MAQETNDKVGRTEVNGFVAIAYRQGPTRIGRHKVIVTRKVPEARKIELTAWGSGEEVLAFARGYMTALASIEDALVGSGSLPLGIGEAET